ncbi:MAG: alpha-L-fucosidase, partial [Candidatus Fimadaptatus sp.]
MDFNSREARAERIRWFQHDRFGMFIHWGLYAIPARGEWLRYYEHVDDEHYQKYFDEFNPVRYDPREWARIAKAAGMKYAVLTAKHHDGFCLFDSAETDFKSTNTPCGRDLVREFLDAFRAEGLKVGLYYSLLDWHHPDFPE